MSIGISTLGEAGESADELIKMADEAMYINKKQKKYSFMHYNDISG